MPAARCRNCKIGGTAHVFNEMKRNSGDAAAEPDRFPVKKIGSGHHPAAA
jgi:hypothetical protein